MASIYIDLKKIEHNARLVAEHLRPHGVNLVGVTKACLGDHHVGKAMLDGGAVALADSRLQNIARLRRHLPNVRLQLMRPPVGEPWDQNRAPDDQAPDLFFVSSAEQAKYLAQAGLRQAASLCLMVETGDGREGVPPDQVHREAAKIGELEGAELAGLATNAACSRQPASLEGTLSLFHAAWSSFPPFPVISIGGSGLLALVAPSQDRREPGDGEPRKSPLAGLTELRSGEALLLGCIPAGGEENLFLPEAHRDAFIIEGRVLELYKKEGRTQALMDFGLQDVSTAPLHCLEAGAIPGQATSDYLAVACEDEAGRRLRVGGAMTFIPSYYALLAAMTSPFVEKIYA